MNSHKIELKQFINSVFMFMYECSSVQGCPGKAQFLGGGYLINSSSGSYNTAFHIRNENLVFCVHKVCPKYSECQFYMYGFDYRTPELIMSVHNVRSQTWDSKLSTTEYTAINSASLECPILKRVVVFQNFKKVVTINKLLIIRVNLLNFL